MNSPRRFAYWFAVALVLSACPAARGDDSPRPIVLVTPLGNGSLEDQSWLREARERAALLETIEYASFGVVQSTRNCSSCDSWRDAGYCGPWIEFNSCYGYCGWTHAGWYSPWWSRPYRQFPVVTHPCWSSAGWTYVDFSYPCGRFSYWCR